MVRKRKPRNKIELPNPAAAPPWIELPEDLTANILLRVGPDEILDSAQKVCTTWRKVCQDPAMWRVIDLKYRYSSNFEPDVLCCLAVERSKGQLLDLSIASFGDDELLNYVADRSSHLRRLKLADCDISTTALTEAVKKLPELQELCLIMMPWLLGTDVETIGISCPMLESLTLNEHGSDNAEYSEDELDEGDNSNECALAIGKNMPNLLHLRLIAIRMENKGLEAILNGCPHLESLDIRQCFGLDLQGALGKRCREQIKDVRLPCDSISDLECLDEQSDDDWDGSLSSDSGDYDFSDLSYNDIMNMCESDNELSYY